MKKRGRSFGAGVLLGVLLLAGVGGLVLDEATSALRGARPQAYRPSAGIPRPHGTTDLLQSVLSVRDFDGVGSRLYLLDPMSPAVHRAELRPDGVRYLGSFGRRGGGPGEFGAPTGIAVLRKPERVAVIEAGRIHFFDLEGQYLESVAPQLPCPSPLPRIATASRGMFVLVDCVRRAANGDTMSAVLAWSEDGRSFTEVTREARYSMDGGFGNPFSASVAFTEGSEGTHLFGTGVSPCVRLVIESSSLPSVEQRCDTQMKPHRLVLSAATRRQMEEMSKRNPALAGMLRAPERDAFYEQALPLGVQTALLRGYSEDSVVLRSFGSAQDAAVLSRNGFVACRRQGCLYADMRNGGTRINMIRAGELQPLMQTAALTR